MRFGTYTFPPTFYVDKAPRDRQVPAAKLPRNDGARLALGYLSERKFSVKGGLIDGGEGIPTAPAPLRAQVDALKAALTGVQAFYPDGGADRYYRDCQVANYSETYEPTAWGHWAEIDLEILAGDPFAYSSTLTTQNAAISSATTTLTVTPAGTAYSLPVISLTAGSTPVVNATLLNVTTGETMQINAAALAPGQVLAMDSIYRQVMVGAVDSMRYIDGLFLRLVPGPNTLVLNVTSGTLTNLQIAYRDRW